MTSLRHNTAEIERREPRDAYLDAARDCILDVGWRRTTLTEVARRAGVSRMTIYRTWARHADAARRPDDPRVGRRRHRAGGPTDDDRPSSASSTGSSARSGTCASNELFVRIVELDPELILPYLFSRRGRSQELILALTADAIAEGQKAGEIRKGNPVAMARGLLLATHGFVLSVHTMVDDGDHRAGARRRARHPDREDPAAVNAAMNPHHPRTRRRPDRGRRRRHRPRHHRRRRRPRRGHPRPVGARRRRPRPRLRYVAVVLQARARRAPLPRRRPGRRGPRERGRARHPDGGHRPAPHACDPDADAVRLQRAQATRPSPPGRRPGPATCCVAAPGPACGRCRGPATSPGPRRCSSPPRCGVRVSAARCSAGTASSRTTPGW